MSDSEGHTPLRELDLDDAIRVQQERFAARIRELRRVPEMMLDAYRYAWAEFYAWEPEYSQQIVSSLQASVFSSTTSFDDLYSVFSHADVNPMDVDGDLSGFSQWFPDRSPAPALVSSDIVPVSAPLTREFAYPKYEACTPATRNILNEHDQRVLRFLPYADEGKIPRRVQRIARPYASFAWQSDWYDVDCKHPPRPRLSRLLTSVQSSLSSCRPSTGSTSPVSL